MPHHVMSQKARSSTLKSRQHAKAFLSMKWVLAFLLQMREAAANAQKQPKRSKRKQSGITKSKRERLMDAAERLCMTGVQDYSLLWIPA